MSKYRWLILIILGMCIFSACASQTPITQVPARSTQKVHNLNLQTERRPVTLSLPSHQVTPIPTPTPLPTIPVPSPTPTHATIATGPAPTNIPNTGSGPSPYGNPPAMTAEETQLTQQLFALINSDRAASGLYAYSFNNTLAGGARLHSWNMYHCGFSHTCPDGIQQCQRIANEGFNVNDSTCGENIGYAGPYPTAYAGVHNIEESMVNEPATAFHHIHLFSTILQRVGVGIYVDPNGYIWFTEDFVN